MARSCSVMFRREQPWLYAERGHPPRPGDSCCRERARRRTERKVCEGRRCGGGRQKAFANIRPGLLAPAWDGRKGGCCRGGGVRGLERSEPVADVALSGPCTASSRVGLLSTQPGFCCPLFRPEVTVRAFESTGWGHRSHKPAHTGGGNVGLSSLQKHKCNETRVI